MREHWPMYALVGIVCVVSSLGIGAQFGIAAQCIAAPFFVVFGIVVGRMIG